MRGRARWPSPPPPSSPSKSSLAPLLAIESSINSDLAATASSRPGGYFVSLNLLCVPGTIECALQAIKKDVRKGGNPCLLLSPSPSSQSYFQSSPHRINGYGKAAAAAASCDLNLPPFSPSSFPFLGRALNRPCLSFSKSKRGDDEYPDNSYMF